MLEEILISNESSNFFKLFVSENNKPKPIRIFINNIILPFGLEEYKNKYIINFELNDKKSSKEYEKLIRLIEKNISNLIEVDNIDIRSVFYKRNNLPILCRGYVNKNRNKIITIYKDKYNNEISLFDLKMKEIYNLELEVSGIWKYGNQAGLYIKIISIKNNN